MYVLMKQAWQAKQSVRLYMINQSKTNLNPGVFICFVKYEITVNN